MAIIAQSVAKDVTYINEVIDAITDLQTSHNRSQDFESQLNAIDLAIKGFDTNNISKSVTDTRPITMELNGEILGKNFDSFQDCSLMDP